MHRPAISYRSETPDDAPVQRRLHELAKDRPAFGSKRIHVLLRRDGLLINFKKVRRLYQEEALQLKRCKRRRRARHPSATTRRGGRTAGALGDRLHARRAGHGPEHRVFTLVDVYSIVWDVAADHPMR